MSCSTTLQSSSQKPVYQHKRIIHKDIHAFGYIDKDDSLILKHIPLSQLFVYLRFYIAL